MSGEVGILNVGAGDTKLSFDPKNPGEVERAKKIIMDMIRRGFAILVEIGRDEKGPMYRRALDFDPETAEYIIAGEPATKEDIDVKEPASSPPRGRKGPRPASPKRIPAASTSAVAVARTAGG